MLDVGRLCIKTAGRDANNYCVIIEKIDDNYVLIDGNVRRKKVNKSHLEPLNKKLEIKENIKKEELDKLLIELGIEIKVRGEARTPKSQEKKVKEKKVSNKK